MMPIIYAVNPLFLKWQNRRPPDLLTFLRVSHVAAVEQREAAFGDAVVVNPANPVFLSHRGV
jgi:hypothetical protein